MSDSLMNTYARLPVQFHEGKGCWLTDSNGKKYLDALSGIAVCSLGHAHPAVTEAVCQQAGKLVHTSNIYGIEHQEQLGDELCRLSGMDRVFFSNSGAEANEAAIKIARLYGRRKEIATPSIIVMENSFHGRTLATLSATGSRKVQAGFEPLVSGFIRVPFNDIEAVKMVSAHQPDVVAVLVEPVQGEGGINVPSPEYLEELRAVCDEHDWLLMLDEIQTGMGRTGKWFAHQFNDIKPDVMTLAKALGNGVPIGACLAAGKASEILSPGTHGSTYGGNPLVCAAALAVIETIESGELCTRAEVLGNRICDELAAGLGDTPGVMEIRNAGLMIGIMLDRPCGELVGAALEDGLLINVTADSTIRLLPPLVMTDEEADQLVNKLTALVIRFLKD